MRCFIGLVVVLVAHQETCAQPVDDQNSNGMSDVLEYLGRAPRDMNSRSSSMGSAGSLLIDRSHGQNFDVSGFTEFLISQGWTVVEFDSGPITESDLAPYDVVMLPVWQGVEPTPFSEAEISAIYSYVEGGGGCWAFNEYEDVPTVINSVTAQFGVTFNNDRVTDPTDNEGEDHWPTIHSLVTHPCTIGVQNYGYYAGCSIEASDPAKVVARGDEDASSSEYEGWAPTLATAIIGRGRVVCSGDMTPLFPSYYDRLRPDEQLLLQNTVNWLACRATWHNYGDGWPGTLGVPDLSPETSPSIGSDLIVSLENSLGVQTQAFLLIGSDNIISGTPFGGLLAVVPSAVVSVKLPAGENQFTAQVPQDESLCGRLVFLQALEIDPGASHGVSFTRGLALMFGK